VLLLDNGWAEVPVVTRTMRLVLLIGVVLWGCGGEKKSAPELALVDGKPVTQAELDGFFKLKRA
jgi:hypothetical protein